MIFLSVITSEILIKNYLKSPIFFYQYTNIVKKLNKQFMYVTRPIFLKSLFIRARKIRL
jgi:hypothetical protein